MNSIIITSDGASLFVNMKPYTVSSDHPKYSEIIKAARDNEWTKIPSLLDIVKVVKESIKQSNNPNIKVVGEQIEYKHVLFPMDLSQYVLNLIRDGFDLTPIIKFMDKLLANPDHRIFQQLFGFMSYGKNPIAANGNVMAYKRVKSNYTSVYDSTTDHSIGKTVSMPRGDCNDNPEETCSYGLHFCSRDYLKEYPGDRIMILEINPADVVSIPVDYNNTKGRACKYKVVGELTDNEIMRITTKDVLKSATVETKYQSASDEVKDIVDVEDTAPVEAAAPSVSYDDIEQYIQGHIDGRKKAPQATTTDMYLKGYKDGKNKKGRRYAHIQ